MKFLPAIAAVALCSAAAAAPIGKPIDSPESTSEQTLLPSDLGFNSDEVEIDEALSDEPQSALIATDIATDDSLSEDELAAIEPDKIDSVPAAERPPVATIALGFIFLGAAGFIRRTRRERRRRRRTLVHMRAIIAAR